MALKAQTRVAGHEFLIKTPIGLIRVRSNTNLRQEVSRPTVYVDFVNVEGDIPLAKVEYDPDEGGVFTKVFGDMYEDNPTHCVLHKGLDLLWDGVDEED